MYEFFFEILLFVGMDSYSKNEAQYFTFKKNIILNPMIFELKESYFLIKNKIHVISFFIISLFLLYFYLTYKPEKA